MYCFVFVVSCERSVGESLTVAATSNKDEFAATKWKWKWKFRFDPRNAFEDSCVDGVYAPACRGCDSLQCNDLLNGPPVLSMLLLTG